MVHQHSPILFLDNCPFGQVKDVRCTSSIDSKSEDRLRILVVWSVPWNVAILPANDVAYEVFIPETFNVFKSEQGKRSFVLNFDGID